MYIRKTIIASAVALVLASTSSVMAEKSSMGEQLPVESMSIIEQAPDGFFVGAPVINNLTVMIVRVYDANGAEVLNVRSKGEPVELLSSGLADGEYHFVVKTIIKLDQAQQIANEFTDEMSSREAGRFTIKNSQVVQPVPEFSDEFSFLDSFIDASLVVAGSVFNTLVSNASAADLVASSFNPTVTYNDTSNSSNVDFSTRVTAAANHSNGSWKLVDEVGFSSPAIDVITINTFVNSAIVDSWVVNSNGTMTWGNQSMYLSKNSLLGLGTTAPAAELHISSIIPDVRLEDETNGSWVEWEANGGRFHFQTNNGTDPSTVPFKVSLSAPTGALEIASDGSVSLADGLSVAAGASFAGGDTRINELNGKMRIGNSSGLGQLFDSLVLDDDSPEIRFLRSGVDGVEIEGHGGFKIHMDTNGNAFSNVFNVFTIANAAPSNSLRIVDNGNVGLGTSSPSQPVHVWRSDGTAGILVEETNATAGPRTLFQIANNGNTKFSVKNTQANVEWAFANPGTGFRLSRQGSGVVEMEILNNGNMVIAGALTQNSDINAKTAITAIDPDKILAQVASLDIKKWEYKDARGEAHIGPMAQDFYAAFNLGGTETGISTIDTAGVALVAIQQLTKLNAGQAKTIANQVKTNVGQANTINQLKLAHQQLLAAYHAQEEKLERMDAMEQKLERMDELEQTVSRLVQSLEGKSIYTSLK